MRQEIKSEEKRTASVPEDVSRNAWGQSLDDAQKEFRAAWRAKLAREEQELYRIEGLRGKLEKLLYLGCLGYSAIMLVRLVTGLLRRGELTIPSLDRLTGYGSIASLGLVALGLGLFCLVHRWTRHTRDRLGLKPSGSAFAQLKIPFLVGAPTMAALHIAAWLYVLPVLGHWEGRPHWLAVPAGLLMAAYMLLLIPGSLIYLFSNGHVVSRIVKRLFMEGMFWGFGILFLVVACRELKAWPNTAPWPFAFTALWGCWLRSRFKDGWDWPDLL